MPETVSYKELEQKLAALNRAVSRLTRIPSANLREHDVPDVTDAEIQASRVALARQATAYKNLMAPLESMARSLERFGYTTGLTFNLIDFKVTSFDVQLASNTNRRLLQAIKPLEEFGYLVTQANRQLKGIPAPFPLRGMGELEALMEKGKALREEIQELQEEIDFDPAVVTPQMGIYQRKVMELSVLNGQIEGASKKLQRQMEYASKSEQEAAKMAMGTVASFGQNVGKFILSIAFVRPLEAYRLLGEVASSVGAIKDVKAAQEAREKVDQARQDLTTPPPPPPKPTFVQKLINTASSMFNSPVAMLGPVGMGAIVLGTLVYQVLDAILDRLEKDAEQNQILLRAGGALKLNLQAYGDSLDEGLEKIKAEIAKNTQFNTNVEQRYEIYEAAGTLGLSLEEMKDVAQGEFHDFVDMTKRVSLSLNMDSRKSVEFLNNLYRNLQLNHDMVKHHIQLLESRVAESGMAPAMFMELVGKYTDDYALYGDRTEDASDLLVSLSKSTLLSTNQIREAMDFYFKAPKDPNKYAEMRQFNMIGAKAAREVMDAAIKELGTEQKNENSRLSLKALEAARDRFNKSGGKAFTELGAVADRLPKEAKKLMELAVASEVTKRKITAANAHTMNALERARMMAATGWDDSEMANWILIMTVDKDAKKIENPMQALVNAYSEGDNEAKMWDAASTTVEDAFSNKMEGWIEGLWRKFKAFSVAFFQLDWNKLVDRFFKVGKWNPMLWPHFAAWTLFKAAKGGINPYMANLRKQVFSSIESTETANEEIRKQLGSIGAWRAGGAEDEHGHSGEDFHGTGKLLSRVLPKGTVTSHIGHRASPGGVGSTDHQGTDVAAGIGTPIYAPRSGRVISAGSAKGFGKWVRIDHGNGLISVYGHVSKIFVKEGQQVHAGQNIAAVGNEGHSTGAHLHFEVRQNGKILNPEAKQTDLLLADDRPTTEQPPGKPDVKAGKKAASTSKPAQVEEVTLADLSEPNQQKILTLLGFVNNRLAGQYAQ